ncbi:MAG TPA: hypothetical protein VIL32_00345 [Steroidobacteraceae bacterium]
MSRAGLFKVLVWVSLLWALPVSCSLRAGSGIELDALPKDSVTARARFE